MPLAHHTHVLAVVQAAAVVGHGPARLGAGSQVGQGCREVAHGHVGRLFVQQPPGVAGGERQDPHGDARRLAFNDLHQRRHQRGGRRVGHGQHKGGCGRGGFKVAGRQGLLQQRQRIAHAGPQCQRPGGRLHPLAAAHHQLVSHHLAQAAHGVAHGGLGDGKLVRCLGQTALRHHFIEHTQQVQIERAKVQMRGHLSIITDVNVKNSKYKFE